MATIRQRKNGNWQAQIERKGFPTVYCTRDTRKEVVAWALETESKMLKGTFHDPTNARNTTLRTALEQYRDEVSPHKKGARQELSRIKYWLQHPLAEKSLAALTTNDFKKYIKTRRSQGLADNTIRLSIAVISHVFTTAREDWDMDGLENPLRRGQLEWPSNSNERSRRVSSEEIDAIIEASESPEMPSAFRLALESAMRRGEIVSLLWENVDLELRVAHLPETKNGHARDVPLSLVAVALLAALPGDRMGRVFGFTDDSFTQAFGRARKRARARYESKCRADGKEPNPKFLVNLRLHDTRHEATTGLFEKGFNTMEAAAVTGHRDLRMLKRYTHLHATDLAPRLDPAPAQVKPAAPPRPGSVLMTYLPSEKSAAKASELIGVPESMIAELLAGRARIDLDLALRFEVLGPRAEMWLGLQSAFDVWQARQRNALPQQSLELANEEHSLDSRPACNDSVIAVA